LSCEWLGAPRPEQRAVELGLRAWDEPCPFYARRRVAGMLVCAAHHARAMQALKALQAARAELEEFIGEKLGGLI
jgi:hypothetical protein